MSESDDSMENFQKKKFGEVVVTLSKISKGTLRVRCISH